MLPSTLSHSPPDLVWQKRISAYAEHLGARASLAASRPPVESSAGSVDRDSESACPVMVHRRATMDNTTLLRGRVLSWLVVGGDHGQYHTPNNRFADLDSVWWRLLRAGSLVVTRLRAVGGQAPSDSLRKKAFWIALCVWGVGAVTL